MSDEEERVKDKDEEIKPNGFTRPQPGKYAWMKEIFQRVRRDGLIDDAVKRMEARAKAKKEGKG